MIYRVLRNLHDLFLISHMIRTPMTGGLFTLATKSGVHLFKLHHSDSEIFSRIYQIFVVISLQLSKYPLWTSFLLPKFHITKGISQILVKKTLHPVIYGYVEKQVEVTKGIHVSYLIVQFHEYLLSIRCMPVTFLSFLGTKTNRT